MPDAPPDGAAAVPVDAGRAPRLRIGVQPAFGRADAGAVVTDLELLETLALGSNALTVTTEQPADARALLQQLASTAELDVILTLPVTTLAAASDLMASIDEAMALFEHDAPFTYLILGERLDKHVPGGEDAGEHAAWVSAVSDALAYAAAHPQLPSGSSVGLGLSATAGVGGGVPEMWVEGTQVFGLTFDGLDEAGKALSPSAATQQWRQSVEAIATYGKPFVFRDLAYPSAHDEQAQREFFSGLRAALVEPPERLAAVVISALDDPTRDHCETWASSWFPASMPTELRCSIGLRDESGNAKPALSEVLEILARHTAP